MYGMIFGWIFFILLIGLVIYLFKPKNTNNTLDKSAQDILDERYAKGEIEQGEYEEKSKNLKHD